MKRKIKVLYVTAEVSPYAQVGGLGEVGASLPKALQNTKGLEIRRVMPCYKDMAVRKKYIADFPVPMGNEFETCILKSNTDNKDIPTYFIGNDRYFYRDSVYGFDDDGFRFFFFCCAVVEMLKYIKFKPDIIHLNDWHTGFIPLLLKKEFPDIKSIFTIHNIQYQGFIPARLLDGLISDKELFQLGWPEWLNFMKAGILYADRVTTVSPTYGEEIQQPSFSGGMDRLIKKRSDGITGILNGIDTELYNPSADGILQYPYKENTIANKKKNRTELRMERGLPDKDIPLVSMITRLDASKGIELLIKALPQVDISTFQLIILGSGSSYYQGLLSSLASEYPDNIVVDYNYSSDLAKRIYAASDIYLMPSQYEPCGLGQLYAMRYGVVPVVNPVGGLRDTVVDDRENPRNSCGFHMDEWSGKALVSALNRAIKEYGSPHWKLLAKNCMSVDSSWQYRAVKYRKLYEEMI